MVQPVTVALYARVSTEEQVDGYSLDAQRRAFKTLIEARGWTVHKEYIEEGRSAHSDDIRSRPVFQAAIQDALAGKYSVLVVHDITRFSRKLRITLEYFEKLGKASVGFVSIRNEIDYSTPAGKFMLVMQGGLAELYSDNLSQEVKKGLGERKSQGLHNGPLPFGVMKGETGVPVPDPNSHPGLVLAFELSAQGKSDSEVASFLNEKGHRTVGNRGGRPFANHSVRGVISNRFYLGYLPDGNGGWTEGKHEAFIDEDLFERAQGARRRRRTSPSTSTPRGKRIWSLSGLTYCWHCKSRVHSQYVYKGVPRLGCSKRQKGWDCPQKTANLNVYEAQLQAYLATFAVPEDYQARILEYHSQLESAYSDAEQERQVLEGRLRRVKELYEWGDFTRSEYQKRKSEIIDRIETLEPTIADSSHLDKLASFMSDIGSAWEAATPEQRNRLARALFEEVWVKDQVVVAAKPRPELDPFFRMNYEMFVENILEGSSSTRSRIH